jgi:cytoskeletal protein RodZ
MAQSLGMQPKAPTQAPPPDNSEALAMQREANDATAKATAQTEARIAAQEEKVKQQEAASAAAADAATRAREGKLRGRLSLLNNEVGVALPAGPGDLQRKLGA